MLGSVVTELINKLNFLEDEDQEAPPVMSSNPFDEPDGDLLPNHLNPFGDPDEEGMFSFVSIILFVGTAHQYSLSPSLRAPRPGGLTTSRR